MPFFGKGFSTRLLLLCLLLMNMAFACKKNPLEDIVNIVWLHSHEEDRDGLKAYRPEDYKFKPSRGRTGFKLLTNDTFIAYLIAPNDTRNEQNGIWRITQDGRAIILEAVGGGRSGNIARRVEFISLQDGLLMVRETELN
ncbi:MAG: hypothetical protein EAZ57_00315 [Cytophagales bacterium]|nr:MAG: hypothetical protein EAZ67_13665 [Cytophagales bacterium]TAF62459.1 MAG: hypothetical protein EAZ57_00315 [Cytophagales bacterium]